MQNSPILQSGAAIGADAVFHEMAKKHKHEIRNFVAYNQKAYVPENVVRLGEAQLKLADPFLISATIDLGRTASGHQYVQNLLRRSYYQVKDSSAVFAVTDFEFRPCGSCKPLSQNVWIRGGTAYACQMFANMHKHQSGSEIAIPLYVYSQSDKKWFQCLVKDKLLGWKEMSTAPQLPNNAGDVYTGIGSRELTPDGKMAIVKLYENV